MRLIHYVVFGVLTLVLGIRWTPTYAQAMTIFGAGSYARECFLAAGVATRLHYAGRGDLKSCNVALENANLSQHDLAATFVNRGIIYVDMKKYGDAASDYATAIALEPHSGVVYVNRGNLSFIDKDYGSAVADYSRALRLGVPVSQVAYYNRGMAFEYMGDLARAERDYRQAIKLAPKWGKPRARLDILLFKVGHGGGH